MAACRDRHRRAHPSDDDQALQRSRPRQRTRIQRFEGAAYPFSVLVAVVVISPLGNLVLVNRRRRLHRDPHSARLPLHVAPDRARGRNRRVRPQTIPPSPPRWSRSSRSSARSPPRSTMAAVGHLAVMVCLSSRKSSCATASRSERVLGSHADARDPGAPVRLDHGSARRSWNQRIVASSERDHRRHHLDHTLRTPEGSPRSQDGGALLPRAPSLRAHARRSPAPHAARRHRPARMADIVVESLYDTRRATHVAVSARTAGRRVHACTVTAGRSPPHA